MRPILVSLTFLLLATGPGWASDNIDLGKIDRKIVKEPAYVTQQPLYGLVVFGPEARTRVWMVLDRSKPDIAHHDVLHVDLNGNGDLTDKGEKFTTEMQGSAVRFPLPDFKDPASDARHTEFNVRITGKDSPTVMVSVMWRGGFKMGGGYCQDPATGYMQLGNSPKTAPVLWANGDGPFRFQRWYSGELTIDGADDFKVFVGQQGVGANSFWAFQQHFLPANEGVQATLLYSDAEGKEHQVTYQLMDRC